MITENNKYSPANITELIKKGISFNDSGNFEEALYYFDRALSIDPENVTAMIDKGFSLKNCRSMMKRLNGTIGH